MSDPEAGAFGGDPAVKAALLARLDTHIAAGTLVLSAPAPWDGARGTPLGISIEGGDPAAYARLFGYPLPLAAALDPLSREQGHAFDGIAFARDWVAAVAPGVDLSPVPARLILDIFGDEDLRGRDMTGEIARYHRAALDGAPPARAEWAALRTRVAAREAEARTAREKAIAAVWSATCWPADQGRSVLLSALDTWRRLRARPGPGWSDEEERQAEAVLTRIWDEFADTIDGAALFREREPALARGYEANRERSNARYLAAGVRIARSCIARFRDADPV